MTRFRTQGNLQGSPGPPGDCKISKHLTGGLSPTELTLSWARSSRHVAFLSCHSRWSGPLMMWLPLSFSASWDSERLSDLPRQTWVEVSLVCHLCSVWSEQTFTPLFPGKVTQQTCYTLAKRSFLMRAGLETHFQPGELLNDFLQQL